MSPRWEARWPGRLQFELDELTSAGAAYSLDESALAEGILALDIDWPLPDCCIRLRAVFPDTFPRTRPEVFGKELPPGRHVHPVTGGICLLGRGTHNWSPDMTLAWLLREQLPEALAASADPTSEEATRAEEHDGIPAEEWWNSIASPGSYCLIDTAWSLDPGRDSGKATLRYVVVGGSEGMSIQAYVETVNTEDGTLLLEWHAPVPQHLKAAQRITVPWARLRNAPLPPKPPTALSPLLSAHATFAMHTPRPVPGAIGLNIGFHCLVYPSELGWRQYGDGWLFLMTLIPWGNSAVQMPIRTLRAGLVDFTARAPSFAALSAKRVAIFGLGAIGAPIALELARQGCRELRAIEYDAVEPGNTVRWPLGAWAWGHRKLDQLKSFIEQACPWTHVVPFLHRLGECPVPGMPWNGLRSADVLNQALDGADLVIDATAEQGINWHLTDLCAERGIPLVAAYATPTVQGGVVARASPGEGNGCLLCLEHAWASGSIPKPPGSDAADAMHQVPGCAERTFTGANFDLGEVSLQAVRTAVDTLADSPQNPAGSLAQIMRLVDERGQRIPPVWQSFPLLRHPECKGQHL